MQTRLMQSVGSPCRKPFQASIPLYRKYFSVFAFFLSILNLCDAFTNSLLGFLFLISSNVTDAFLNHEAYLMIFIVEIILVSYFMSSLILIYLVVPL